MNSGKVLALLKEYSAMQTGHFELSSGLHSDTYVQCTKVLQYPKVARKIGKILAKGICSKNLIKKPTLVISPAIGGIVIGYEVARALGARAIFAERSVEGKMILKRGFWIRTEEAVLVVEDVITTGGTTQEILDLVRQERGDPAGVACIVDRSRDWHPRGGLPLFAAIHIQVENYEAGTSTCPICKKGFPLVKPGSRKR